MDWKVVFKDELLGPNGQMRSKYQGQSHRAPVGPYLNTEYLGFQTDVHLPGMPITTTGK
jgi:hypothetical protein